MKFIVVGSGGREHALAWKLLQSPSVREVICVPGNGGTARLPGCRNLPLAATDAEGIARFALVHNVPLVVIGPEQPLAEGMADHLRSQDLKVFGPSQAGAQIEASKVWAKDLMQQAGIPTAASATFTDAAAALAYLEQQTAPIVIKADGLAAGKGVTVATSLEMARQAVEAAFQGQFGAAGQQILIEECLTGQEASVLAVTDGITVRPLLPAQDHKPLEEGDTGPNTGGMGAYAPTPVVPPTLMERICAEVLEPAVAQLRSRGIDYCGVLYAGLMITPAGDPKVIEFNCRFGDPETQALLPLLETPLADIILACCEQRLTDLPPLEWQPGASVCVVMAAAGYPERYPKNMQISGTEAAEGDGVWVFHAGTRWQGNQLRSTGGRVLGVTGMASTLDQALTQTYAAMDKIHFDHSYYRRDIGYRVQGRARQL